MVLPGGLNGRGRRQGAITGQLDTPGDPASVAGDSRKQSIR